MLLQEMTWPEVGGLPAETPVVFPVAALEQHGRHMPVFTDSLLLGEVVRRAAERLRRPRPVRPAAVAGQLATTTSTSPARSRPRRGSTSTCSPACSRTSSPTGSAASCCSTATAATSCRSSRPSSRSASGTGRGTTCSCSAATYWTLGAEPHEADAGIEQDRMGHACEWETSMMLRLDPAPGRRPRRGRAGARSATPFEPASRGWITQDRSEPGHIGDPRGATAEKGEIAVPALRRRRRAASSNASLAWDGAELGRMTARTASGPGLALVGLRAAAAGDHAQLHGPPDALAVGRPTSAGSWASATRITASSSTGFGLAFAAGGIVTGFVADRVEPALALPGGAAGVVGGRASPPGWARQLRRAAGLPGRCSASSRRASGPAP